PLLINKGDVFFLSMRVNSPNAHMDDDNYRAVFLYSPFSSLEPGRGQYYPSRNWKFYEHDSGPSNCAGKPADQIKRGWVARGPVTDDTLQVAVFNFWYSVFTSDNTPPKLLSATTLYNTISTDPRPILAELEDCDPSDPGRAGIERALLSYYVNGEFVDTIPLTPLGGNTYESQIPGVDPWNTVNYSIIIYDALGVQSLYPQPGYQVIGLENEYFAVDNSGGCTTNDIRNTGTEVLSSAFFLPPDPPSNARAKDDGSAGPFSLGGSFNFFGQDMRYAWIGVNGAITLTETATETLDVNSNGFYSGSFAFPGSMKLRSDPRDTAGLGRKPYNMISAFWNDLIYGDTALTSQYGHILYENQGCEFVIQYDSMAVFDEDGNHFLDEIKFRIILNKCNGSITFQYDNVGTQGLDTTALIGIQADSIETMGKASPWIFINQDGYPAETAPVNGKCLRIYQASATYVNDKWNMVSVGNIPSGGNYAANQVYPTKVSQAFRYEAAYLPTDTLKNGPGYWAKFIGAQVIGASGSHLSALAIPVVAGWNMVGSISCPVATSSIVDVVVAGKPYYGFEGGYVATTTLVPGKGYWVNASDAGTMNLSCATGEASSKYDNNYALLAGSSNIVIKDNEGYKQTLYLVNKNNLKVPVETYELPPVPPTGIFDARFKSNGTVEAYTHEQGKVEEYIVKIQASSSAYPLSLQWNMTDKSKSVVMYEQGDKKNQGGTTLTSNGSMHITNPAVSSLVVKVVDAVGLPTEYALGQNYPNPFNPVTRFNVAIPQTGNVEVSVFDILGRKVSTIIDGELKAG
ncbi:MAG: T9SS type A sorting domain-containing protein, partial [Ignavibacteriae bacterium]|nr:T9SS type A sorting domain-containing protein [Ignavibacteriota bacterium]